MKRPKKWSLRGWSDGIRKVTEITWMIKVFDKKKNGRIWEEITTSSGLKTADDDYLKAISTLFITNKIKKISVEKKC